MRILVADDDFFFRHLVDDMLSEAGHEVHTVPDGETTLAQAPELQPDLIVLDIVMPGLLGVEVSRTLRRDPRMDGVPILLASTSVSQLEAAKVNPGEHLADDFIKKPFEAGELLERIERLARKAEEKAAEKVAAMVESRPADPARPAGPAPPPPPARTGATATRTIDITLDEFNAGIFLGHPMINLHLGGICLNSDEPVEQDTVVNLHFTLPDGETIEVLGDVTWCLQHDDGERWIYGVHFLDIDADEDDRLVAAAEGLV